jgi:two-component system, sensor histidine kinase and response regulator
VGSLPGTAAAGPPVDLTTAKASVGGDRGLLEELISMFRNDWRTRFNAIRQALQAGDVRTACQATHTLKSALSALGAHAALTLTLQLETACQTGDLRAGTELLTALEDELEQIAERLTHKDEDGHATARAGR